MSELTIRKATDKDVDLIFEWANDEDERKYSFNPEKIKYEDHIKWYKKKTESEDSVIFVCMLDSEPIGQCRLDFEGEEALISYFIDRKFRNRGYGKKLLSLLAKKTACDYPRIKRLKAEVKAENIPSQKVFEAMGYSKDVREADGVNEYRLSL